MKTSDKIRAEALIQAMLALGLREMEIPARAVHDAPSYEIESVVDKAARCVRLRIRQPVLIEGAVVRPATPADMPNAGLGKTYSAAEV